MSFAEQVLATIRSEHLIGPGERVLVAVSGGGDSVAMLHVLAELAPEIGCRLHVAHLNHRIRTEADDDARFVGELAANLGLPVIMGEADVPARRAAQGGSLEHVARTARYEFFLQAARDVGATVVATGHTADDQVETVLHNLLRGGSVDALRGISICRPIEEGSAVRIVRPLLRASRADVLGFLASRSIGFCTDVSNADVSLTRNRIRLRLLPELETLFNPSVGEAVLRTAESAQAASCIVHDWLRSNLPHVVNDEGCLLCERLAQWDRPVRKLLVTAALDERWPGAGVPHRHVGAVVELLDQPDGAVANLASGWRAIRTDGHIQLQPPAEEPPVLPLDAALAVPGCVSALENELLIRAETVTPDSDMLQRFLESKTRWEEMVDADAAGENLRVRWRRNGDRFRPLGAPGAKKLQDFFVDEKVPAWQRDRVPLVLGADGIVWVVGHRIDDSVRITQATRRFLLLKATWKQDEDNEW